MIEHVLHLILLLLAARSFGEIATRIGQPALVGEIGAGLALAVLAASLNAPFLAELSRSAFLDLTAEFGIFFLLLLAGLEIAPGELFRHSGRSAAVALGGVLLPLALGLALAWWVQDGQPITLSCAEGDRGAVYEGTLEFETIEFDLADLPETETDVMLNIASPAAAMRWWRLPARGVGLARMEFVINHLVKVHPMALVAPEKVTSEDARRAIAELTRGYAEPADYFVDTLALGIAKLAAPFHPQPVIVRLSDFKTNEYAHLLGGEAFEPDEENPMIGSR